MAEAILKADFHRERFKFRFISLDDAAIARLRAFLPEADLRVHTRDSGAVVTLLLTETLDRNALYAFLDGENLNSGQYSVWTSVVSSSDQDGVALPDYVLDIIRNTRCGADFSFVGCLDDPSGAELVLSPTEPAPN